MTTFDRFDPFERRIGAAMDDIAGTRSLDYLDDVFRQTARTAQRPRWSFPERWFNVDTTLPRPSIVGGRLPTRTLLMLALLLAALAASAVYFGTQRQLPTPFRPAGNGLLAYDADGDIYVRDAQGNTRRIVGGTAAEFGPAFSPDGTRISYVANNGATDSFYVADADGSDAVKVADIPPGNAQGAWAPDSRRVALIYDVVGHARLRIVDAEVGTDVVVDLGDLTPWDVAWLPPVRDQGDRLVIRAQDPAGRMDIYTVRDDGSELKAFGLGPPLGTEFLTGLSVSPDGSTIAYNGLDAAPGGASPGSLHFRVHLVGVDGSNDRALVGPADPRVEENWPVYSPDGNWLAVVHWQFTNGIPGTKQSLAIMPSDGSEPAREIGPRFDDTTRDAAVRKIWSPDGTRILMSGSGATDQVYSVDPVSGSYELLPWTSTLPDWQRASR